MSQYLKAEQGLFEVRLFEEDDVATSSTMDEAVYTLKVDHPMQLQAHQLLSILDVKNKGCITASHLKVHLRSNTRHLVAASSHRLEPPTLETTNDWCWITVEKIQTSSDSLQVALHDHFLGVNCKILITIFIVCNSHVISGFVDCYNLIFRWKHSARSKWKVLASTRRIRTS